MDPLLMKEHMAKSMQGLFMEISRRYMGKCFYQMHTLGIHPRQIPILCTLYHKDGCSQREIAEALGVKPPTVTVSIQRLEKSGIICRRQDKKDQRVSRIYLTEEGRKIIAQGMKQMEKMEEVVFGHFSEAELCLLRRFFEQIRDNIDGMPGPDGQECAMMAPKPPL